MIKERAARAHEILRIEKADAWFHYLEETQNLKGSRYDEVENWAYARLQQRLRAIKAKRSKVAA